MNILDITLLSEDQICGNNQLDILKKYGTKCAITDFSILLGGGVSLNYYTWEGRNLKNRTGLWWTKTPYYDYARLVFKDGTSGCNSVSRRIVGARPALSYSSIQSISSNGVRDASEILEVLFGEYPQTIVDENYSRELERAYNNRSLRTTGKNYTTDSVRYQDTDTSFRARTHTEYEYNGSKYIRFIGDENGNGEILSDGRKIEIGEPYWVKVEPITWIVDEKTGIAISKKILFAGVQFKNTNEYDGNFLDTDIKHFLDTCFSKEIVQTISYNEDKSNDNLNEKSKAIDDIVNEIYSLLGTYYGDEDIKKKVSDLINKYNEDLKNSFNSTSGLTLTPTLDKKALYYKLMMDLQDILTELKLSSEKYKEYYLMLDLVQNCLDILDGKDNTMLDDLSDDVMTIKHVVMPFLNDNSKNGEIKNIFLEEKNNILSYVIGSDNSIKECKTYEDFKIRIRKKLYPFLISINNDVRNKDLINEIKDGYLKVCEGIYNEEKQDYINNLYNEIRKLIDEINIKGNDSEKQRLDEILKEKLVFDDKDLIKSINLVRELYMSIYKIVLDIYDRENKMKELEEYTVITPDDKVI